MSALENDRENRPAFTAQLPPAVRYCNELSSTAKLLFAEVSALCLAEGFCWASNGYFARLFGVTKIQVSRLLKQLSDAGFIEIKQFRERANYREIHMLPTAFSGCNPMEKQVEAPINKNVKGVNKNDKRVLTKMLRGINKNVNSYKEKNIKEKYKGKGTHHFSSDFSSKPRAKSFDQIDREAAAAFTKNSIAEFLADQGGSHVAN